MNSQDLSLAGKCKGMSKGSSTRSGLLWEVERILDECKEIGNLPQILLMENVPQVIGNKNIKDFQNWEQKLESLGYSNYIEKLNSKEYLIPQNRDRCFMISILGDYSYNFPTKKKLGIRLKDVLENNVDESYYLTTKQIINIKNWKTYQKPLENMDKIEKTGICPTLTTQNSEYSAGMILIKSCRIQPKDRNYNKNGSKREEQLEIRKDDVSNCLLTNNQNNLVAIQVIPFGSYYSWKDNKGNINTQCNRASNENGCSQTITTNFKLNKVFEEATMRIRNLIPRERFKLMGVKNEDYNNVEIHQSKASLYHLAGDSIVTSCLMGIFGELLEIDWKAKVDEIIEDIVENKEK